jgi:hypothetical protein
VRFYLIPIGYTVLKATRKIQSFFLVKILKYASEKNKLTALNMKSGSFVFDINHNFQYFNLQVSSV